MMVFFGSVGDNFENTKIMRLAKIAWAKLSPETKSREKSEFYPVLNTITQSVSAKIYKDKVFT